MDGLASADSCPGFLLPSRGEDTPGRPPKTQSAGFVPSPANSAPESAADEVQFFDPAGHNTDAESLSRVLESLDLLVQIQQRGEEIRTQLNKIDAILLQSRTVAALIERVIRVLEHDLDLTMVRILLQADHPVSRAFRWISSPGSGLISRDHPINDFVSLSPHVLDDPSGALSASLFGESASTIGSAVLAHLCAGQEDLGLMCLASSNPRRYFDGMNMELIAGLADKIALGINNAWEHENATRNLLHNHELGIFTETFFLEYLGKEFNRAWRNRRPFSLVAMSWSSAVPGIPSSGQVTECVLRNIRSADVAAQAGPSSFLLLLPDTPVNGAMSVMERLTAVASEQFHENFVLRAGVTEFSKDSAVVSVLLDRARSALHKAEEQGEGIVSELY